MGTIGLRNIINAYAMDDKITEELRHLYHDTRHMIRKIERMSYRPDYPNDVKYEVLKPIRPKLAWLKTALAAKIGGDVNAKAYKENYNEEIEKNRILRIFSRMTPNQQEFAANMIRWIAEEEEEIF